MYIGEITDEPVTPPTPECQDGPYGLIINGTDTVLAKAFDELDGAGRKQYQADSVVIKAGDKIVVANLSCTSKWVMDVEEFGAYADFEKGENEYTAKKDGMYVFFIKMSMEAGDVMYIGEITDEPVTPPTQEHQNGYYLMGSHNDWAIDDAYLFVRNEKSEVEEYSLNVTLTVGQKIKPAYIENDKEKEWYGDSDFEITEAYAGAKTVYFRPVRNGDWGEFGGFIYIADQEGTGLFDTAVEGKAVKTISNGMLIIEKAGVRYNVMGQIIR